MVQQCDTASHLAFLLSTCGKPSLLVMHTVPSNLNVWKVAVYCCHDSMQHLLLHTLLHDYTQLHP
jgi:hypothetical protein